MAASRGDSHTLWNLEDLIVTALRHTSLTQFRGTFTRSWGRDPTQPVLI